MTWYKRRHSSDAMLKKLYSRDVQNIAHCFFFFFVIAVIVLIIIIVIINILYTDPCYTYKRSYSLCCIFGGVSHTINRILNVWIVVSPQALRDWGNPVYHRRFQIKFCLINFINFNNNIFEFSSFFFILSTQLKWMIGTWIKVNHYAVKQ